MDIWLDTMNISLVERAVRLGVLSGVTTNPSLIAQSKSDLEQILEELLHHQEGPVAVQVVAEDVIEMVQQGQILYSLSNRLIIKVPITKNGLEAIHLLSRQGIPTMATAVFHPHQAFLAALAGAQYVAPYLGRLEKMGGNPWDMLKKTVDLFHHYKIKTKILVASLSTIEQVMQCAEMGVYGVTVKDNLFNALIETDSFTLEAVQKFAQDWENVKSSLFVS